MYTAGWFGVHSTCNRSLSRRLASALSASHSASLPSSNSALSSSVITACPSLPNPGLIARSLSCCLS